MARLYVAEETVGWTVTKGPDQIRNCHSGNTCDTEVSTCDNSFSLDESLADLGTQVGPDVASQRHRGALKDFGGPYREFLGNNRIRPAEPARKARQRVLVVKKQ